MLAFHAFTAVTGAALMSNEQIIEQIRERYDRDERIQHPVQVAISEKEGTVTLRGTVPGLRQRRAAIDLAKSVRGVRSVVDELVVDPRDHYLDDEIRGAALQALMSNDDVPVDDINVTVSDAWLTLSGRVKRQSESNAAFETVSGLSGVGGITNKIQVVTAGGF
jgi:osmotically-inducible protein OsmY